MLRFQTKIVLLLVTVFSVIQLFCLIIFHYSTKTIAAQQLFSNMIGEHESLLHYFSRQEQRLAKEARLLANDPELLRLLATSPSSNQLASMMQLSLQESAAERVLFLDPEGRILADSSGNELPYFPLNMLLKESVLRQQTIVLGHLEKELHSLVTTPCLVEGTLKGFLVFTQLLPFDTLPALTLSTVTFVLKSIKSPQLEPIASQLEVAVLEKLSTLSKDALKDYQPTIVSLANQPFVAVLTPLSSIGDSTINLLLTSPLNPVLEQFVPLEVALAFVSSVGLFCLVLLGIVLARNISNPLRQLTKDAERVAKGYYEQPIFLQRSDELGFFATALEQMRQAIAGREQKIQYQLEHDLSTGLPNRLLFTKTLHQMISSSPECLGAIFIIEVENLATIYHTLGHAVAELVIDAFSKKLGKDLKQYQFSRFSENKFTCCLFQEVTVQHTSRFAEKLLAFFDEPTHLGTLHVDLSGQVGIALYPLHAKEAHLLVQRADTASFQARQDPLRYSYYDAQKDPYHSNQLSLMSELRFGLIQNEFQLFFQPKVSLKTNRIIGAESLVRWNHKKRGMVPPDLFIPQAELSGQVHHLTSWVIQRAFEQLAAWQTQHIHFAVGINLSVKDLLNKNLTENILGYLKSYKIEPQWVIFEITESVFMSDPEGSLAVIQKLHHHGFHFSIDDFGIGYSSFSYLKKIPLYELKIDKSFTQKILENPQEAAIVQTIIELAHRLQLKVTAEGVESEHVAKRLSALGCDVGQGYFYSKPLPIQAFTEWLHTSAFGYTLPG